MPMPTTHTWAVWTTPPSPARRPSLPGPGARGFGAAWGERGVERGEGGEEAGVRERPSPSGPTARGSAPRLGGRGGGEGGSRG